MRQTPRMLMTSGVFGLLMIAAAVAQPTVAPPLIDVSDHAALQANLGQDVLVEGVCSKAEWSQSGKVMTVMFRGVDRKKFVVVAFDRIRPRLDPAFMGDAAANFTGAKLRVRGKVGEFNGALQVVIDQPSSVTVVEPAQGTGR